MLWGFGNGAPLLNDRKNSLPEIRNPNLDSQGPGGGAPGGDNRSFILLMGLALVAVMAFQWFKKPDTSQPAQQSQTQQVQQSSTAPSAPAAVSGTTPPGQAAPATTAQIGAQSETTTTIENEKFRITFTNKGAQVQHWILKGFVDSAGKPLDMVQEQAAARFGKPLSRILPRLFGVRKVAKPL